MGADLRSGAFARGRRPGRARYRSRESEHPLRGDQQPRGLAVLRRNDAAAGGPLQIDRQRRELDPARVGLPAWPFEQCEPPVQPAHHRRHRRSGQHADPLPRLQCRPLRVQGRRLQLDAGRGPNGGCAHAGAGRDLAPRRAHPVRRRLRRRRGSVHRRGAHLEDDPQRCHSCSGRRPSRRRLRQGRHRARASGHAAEPCRHPGALRNDGRIGERATHGWPFPEHGSGQYLERSRRYGINGNNPIAPRRLQFSHGRRPGFARRRGGRHHLFRQPIPSEVH